MLLTMPPFSPPSETDVPTDAELLAAWCCRDDGAFTAFFRRHAGLVYHTALRQGAATDAAAEVVQAVMTAAARKAALLQKAANVPGWLHRATLLEMRRLRRRQGREARHRESFATASTMQTPPIQAPDQSALQAEIDGALLRLSDKEQAYVFQRFYEGRSVREIAAGSGETEAAVQKRGHRALERLASFLSRRRAVVSVPVVMAALARGLQETAPAALLEYGPAAAIRAAGTASVAGGPQWLVAQAGAACLLVGGAVWQEQQIPPSRPGASVVSGVRPSASPHTSGTLTARPFRTPEAAFDPDDPDLAALAEFCYRDSLGAADRAQHSRVFHLIIAWCRDGKCWPLLEKLYALNIPAAHRRELAARVLSPAQSRMIPERLEWTLRFHEQNDPPGEWHKEFTKSIVSTLWKWAKENPEAAWQWMQQHLASGTLHEARGYDTRYASGPAEKGLAILFDVVAAAGKTELAEEILAAMKPKERSIALGTRLKSLTLDSPESIRYLAQITGLYGERLQDVAWNAAEGFLDKVSPQHVADTVIRFTNESPLVAMALIDQWAEAASSRKLTREDLLKAGMSRGDLDALMPPAAP